MIMAKAVDELARKTPGKKSHAIDAFSRALLAIPTTIADNAGLDSAELIAQLRAEHHKESSNAGIDVITGSVSKNKHSVTCLCFFLYNRLIFLSCYIGWRYVRAWNIRGIQSETGCIAFCNRGCRNDSES